jgi:GNAT superfamily N-acetyltransferase
MKIRRAKREDLKAIVNILANDKLGRQREDSSEPLVKEYERAFDIIDKDSSQSLLVAENDSGEVVGTLQLSFIQYLNYRGSLRAQAETVFVREDQQGKGIGTALMNEAIRHAKEIGARLIQLTTDKQRPEALRFYEKLGFKASHEGMKLHFK